MNELRMYVEHLFRGRVLTDDAIELKEEIYGNLVARYEDYLASGLSEEEALERTKASMTSLDDVLDGSEGPEGADDDAVGSVPDGAATDGAAAGGGASIDGVPVPPDASAPATQVLATGEVPAEAATQTSNPGPAKPSRKKLYIGLGIAAVALLIAIGGCSIVAEMREDELDRQEDIAEAQAERDRAQSNANAQSDGSDASNGEGTGSQIHVMTPTEEISDSILANDPSVLKTYAGVNLNDAPALTDLIAQLPLGADYAKNVSSDGAYSISFDLVDIPEAIDGDVIEQALAYDTAAIFAAAPDVQTISMNVSELDDDGSRDVEQYVFERANHESALRFSSTHEGGLNASLFDDPVEWGTIRTQLVSERVCDDLIERAERS